MQEYSKEKFTRKRKMVYLSQVQVRLLVPSLLVAELLVALLVMTNFLDFQKVN